MVRTWCFHCGDLGSISHQETEILQAVCLKRKKKIVKKRLSRASWIIQVGAPNPMTGVLVRGREDADTRRMEAEIGEMQPQAKNTPGLPGNEEKVFLNPLKVPGWVWKLN